MGTLALNLIAVDTDLSPSTWPDSVTVERDTVAVTRDLRAPVLLAGLALLLIDILAALWVSGRLRGSGAVAALFVALMLPVESRAQDSDDRLALQATGALVLGHVLSGERRVDDMAEAGLRGLSRILFARTSIEPDPPIGIDLERDELTFFPVPLLADHRRLAHPIRCRLCQAETATCVAAG